MFIRELKRIYTVLICTIHFIVSNTRDLTNVYSYSQVFLPNLLFNSFTVTHLMDKVSRCQRIQSRISIKEEHILLLTMIFCLL